MRRYLVGYLLLALSCAFLGGPAFGQATEDDRRAPALVAQLSRGDNPLSIQTVKTEVDVVGVLAETTMTLTFYNPNGRQLAGDFSFPLPEGATVSGYALDVNGVMIDGVPVEKQKGREVFEQEVRKNVDPGLIEMTKGNTFKTRVYPIPPRGTRTVRVKYVHNLVRQDDASLFVLPLNFAEPVQEFSLRMAVRQADAVPDVKSGKLANFSFSAWHQGYMAETTLKGQKLLQTLRIAIPGAAKPSVTVEKDDKGDRYFFVHDFVQAPSAAATEKAPSRIAIFWDASASREKADLTREKSVLTHYFRAFSGKTVTVDLVVFRNAREPVKTLSIRDGDLRPLFEILAELPYDGGTSLGAMSPAAGDPAADVALLFSDGLSNFGPEEPSGLNYPVYCCVSSPNANFAYLRYLAQKTGGAVLNLDQLTDEAAARILGRPVFSFLSVTCDGAAITETYPNMPRMVSGDFFLAGKLEREEAQITLNYGIGGKVMTTNTFQVAAAQAVEGDLLRRFWAQRKVEDLQVYPKKNKDEIINLGKKYGIVTPETSLIVLERLDQYIEHEIVPPKGMPDWRRDYFATMERRASERQQVRASKLEQVVSMWQQRVAWWNTDFDLSPAKDSQKIGALESQSLSAPGGAVPDMELSESDSNGPVQESMARRSDDSFSGAMPSMAAPSRANEMMMDSSASEEAKGDVSTKEKSAPEPQQRAVEPGVVMKAWDPKTPYLDALKKAGPKAAYAEYLAQRKEYRAAPAFYLDCADYFFKNELPALGLRVLSNIAELEMENPALMRVLAHRLAQLEELELSAGIFEEILKLRREEPQSYRDLALVLGRMGTYGRTVELLYEVVLGAWDGRFPEIEAIALLELNNLLAKAKAKGVPVPEIDPRLEKNLELDIRIVMTWDADLTDMDLWVLEPSGEKAYYGHNRTRIGGLVSRDFTQGYGPEEYLLRKSMRGMYTIQTNFYGSRAQSLVGAVTLQAEVFSNYGRPNEKRRSLTMRLTDRQETFTVGEMEF